MKSEWILISSYANEISEKTPNLCHLAPAGYTYIEELNEAGGVYAVMNELDKLGLIHKDCMTVTGKTVGENIAGCENKNPEVIRPIDNPYTPDRRPGSSERKSGTGRKCSKTFRSSGRDAGT